MSGLPQPAQKRCPNWLKVPQDWQLVVELLPNDGGMISIDLCTPLKKVVMVSRLAVDLFWRAFFDSGSAETSLRDKISFKCYLLFLNLLC